VSYNHYDSTIASQLTAASSWIRRTLTPAAAASFDAVLAAAASARRTGLTGKWIDKIDRHSYNRRFSPSTQSQTR